MTCREKLKLEHPGFVSPKYKGGCLSCPSTYGYLNVPLYCDGYASNHICTKCWDREIPGTKSLTYEHAGKPIGKVTEIIEDESGVTAKIAPINSHYVQNEKENTMATKKTKAELEKELETIKESKAELEKELKNLEKYKQYEDMAGEVHAIYVSFVHAGFSEEQAYDLLKTMIQNAGNINFNCNATVKPSYRYAR